MTGSVPRKKDNPGVPVTPSEQIESTHQSFDAGPSFVPSTCASRMKPLLPIASCLLRCKRACANTVP